MNQTVSDLNLYAENHTLPEVLQHIAEQYANSIVFTTSFGLEDQIITHLIFTHTIPIEVITLDTGRLFKETYKVYNKTLEKYKKPIVAFFPDTTQVETMLREKGPMSFYNSVEDRKECCTIRKVLPLNRALADKKMWITGIRAEQSSNRKDLTMFEYDADREMIKCNLLIDWTFTQVQDYVKKEAIPYNILHDKGFVSIGCEPCTRAIKQGEDFRAGRWWWEDNSKKECGLHTHS
ncbi:MAG: phosphoadenylyl-sulfate reductase [Bacteroidales bacterium]|jgi:phosphoadenosine phosphosulfate reductase|nr:phosphoadenylyl-sulfate reductase [Bacteroidales bacterium]NLK81988.1 phosphoadenylyl-sulfate reductase [Bacteroidales bacterium]HPY81896.1 phosphoadenylyl-sulfate reductase [Bacteroidales bacterium]